MNESNNFQVISEQDSGLISVLTKDNEKINLENYSEKIEREIVFSGTRIDRKLDEDSEGKSIMEKSETSELQQKKKSNKGFYANQKWEGTVEDVYEEFFTAKLSDLTNAGTDEYAEIFKTDVSIKSDLKLIERGADNMAIHQHVFDSNSPSRLHLLGVALRNMVISPEYRTAYITLSQEELDTHNFKKGDTEGFVNYGLTLEGIIFAVIFIEYKDEGIIKISFRSIVDFSVYQFARNHFNGGGHDNAAGGRSDVSLPETVAQFQKLLPQYAKQLNP